MSVEDNQPDPYSHVFVGPKKTVAICGPSLVVLDSHTGTIISSTLAASSDNNASTLIRVAAVDRLFNHLVTSGEDKRLRVWDVNKLEELSSREVPKRVNVLKLSQDGKTILAADKFGDIFSYPLIPSEKKSVPTVQLGSNGAGPSSKSISVAMHDNPEGTLILGHTSIVTVFTVTPGEKLIISADRDEHIRVSWYPDGWDVERYCLGHKKFISAIEVLSCAPDVLISGGGDPELHVWEYRLGKLLGRIPIWDKVQPFLKVRGGRKKWKENEGKRASKSRKGKTKQEDEAVEKETPEAEPMDTAPSKSEVAGVVFDEEVLVVSHITQARLGSNEVVLFSAVGASALFYFQWPSSLDFAGVSVQAVDFSNPVIQFNVTENGEILVSVDPTWSTNPGAVETAAAVDHRRIRRLVWGNGAMIEDDSSSQLLNALNEECVIKDSSKQIQFLDFYDSLIALPKIAEPENTDGMEPEESGTPAPSDITSGPGLRASARQRTKEQLEKRKAATQETSRSLKQPRIEEGQ